MRIERITAARALRCLPNALTLARMAGALALPFLPPPCAAFFAVYTLCGVSDMLDGPLARALHVHSAAGARLDSAADLLFCLCAALALYGPARAALPGWALLPAAGAALLRLLAMLAGALARRGVLPRHTALNRLAGALAFAAPYFLGRKGFPCLCAAAGAVCCLAAGLDLSLRVRGARPAKHVN